MLNNWSNIHFAQPLFLWLILGLVILFGLWFYFNYKKYYPSFTLSNSKAIQDLESWKGKFLPILPLLRFLTLALILIALARPQSSSTEENIKTYGIDMVISMDVSLSMLAQDFKPNRLEAAKNTAAQFIENRSEDRIGLVIFGGESFTQVPITTDHKIVQSQLAKIKYGLIADGTAIGMGIGTAVNRLKDSESESKVVILLTDGVNNTGLIDPKTAAELAVSFGIKIYTIGIGSSGEAYTPLYPKPDGTFEYGYYPVEIDEALLQEIAQQTGGKYYRAKSTDALESIYAEIDQLEKTEIETSQTVKTKELFYPFVGFALLLLFVEQLLKYTLLRVFP